MVKAIALNSIHLCREPGKRKTPTSDAIPAKIDEIAPGKIFEIAQAKLDELPVGSARAATRAELAAAGIPDETVKAAQKAIETAEAALAAAKTDDERASASSTLEAAKAKLAELVR